jgi:heavy metal sensor kinase
VGGALLFRQQLKSSLESQSRDDLDQRWTAVKANLRFYGDDDHIEWFFDRDDPEENRIGADVKSVYLITDAGGTPKEWSKTYEALGFDTPDYVTRTLNSNQPQWERKSAGGTEYLIRSSYTLDQSRNHKFYVALGKSRAGDKKTLRDFTVLCFAIIPLVALLGMAAGWLIAGRALEPVMAIALAAQRISGSNLSLRIPARKTTDELEYLIETFNDMIARLEQNFIQVRQFSTDVSHELRTPITIVRGQLEVALFTAHTAEQYRDAIITAMADVERLSQIVRALLLLSQAETGQVVLQLQTLDLCETARNITEQFEIPAEGSGVEISFSSNGGNCAGEFDRVQIERMLSNLISNAVKFTPAGGEVRVSVDRVGDQAQLVVQDTGQGIAPEHLPHIFDRFYRVRDLREQASPEKGLGLGLSFVNWIVKAHSGTIDVQSEPGKGTTFTVWLPFHSHPAAIRVSNVSENTPESLMKSV